jgi:hypothetical protein
VVFDEAKESKTKFGIKLGCKCNFTSLENIYDSIEHAQPRILYAHCRRSRTGKWSATKAHGIGEIVLTWQRGEKARSAYCSSAKSTGQSGSPSTLDLACFQTEIAERCMRILRRDLVVRARCSTSRGLRCPNIYTSESSSFPSSGGNTWTYVE